MSTVLDDLITKPAPVDTGAIDDRIEDLRLGNVRLPLVRIALDHWLCIDPVDAASEAEAVSRAHGDGPAAVKALRRDPTSPRRVGLILDHASMLSASEALAVLSELAEVLGERCQALLQGAMDSSRS